MYLNTTPHILKTNYKIARQRASLKRLFAIEKALVHTGRTIGPALVIPFTRWASGWATLFIRPPSHGCTIAFMYIMLYVLGIKKSKFLTRLFPLFVT